jgi:ribonuclease P protein component
MKRQVREGIAKHRDKLPPGLWIVRLRAAFSAAAYPSAVSNSLQGTVRTELEDLLRAAAQKACFPGDR